MTGFNRDDGRLPSSSPSGCSRGGANTESPLDPGHERDLRFTSAAHETQLTLRVLSSSAGRVGVGQGRFVTSSDTVGVLTVEKATQSGATMPRGVGRSKASGMGVAGSTRREKRHGYMREIKVVTAKQPIQTNANNLHLHLSIHSTPHHYLNQSLRRPS